MTTLQPKKTLGELIAAQTACRQEFRDRFEAESHSQPTNTERQTTRVVFNTGDVVYHRPSDEEWIVAFADKDELVPIGWPLSYAKQDDCILVLKADDDTRLSLLIDMANSKGVGDCRKAYAIETLRQYCDDSAAPIIE